MTRTLRLLIALLATAALVLTACGGDDDGDGGSTAAIADADPDDGDEGSDDADLPDIGNVSERCMEAYAAFSEVAGSAGALGSGEDLDLEENLEQLQAFADVAPDEIKDEMQVLAEAYGSFIGVMIESGFDPNSEEMPDEETMAALTEAMESLSAPEVAEASQAVSTYFATQCGGGE